jgi:hypothetical protein
LVNSNSWLENTHEPLNIAFNMAIKALEQEPTTKNDLGIDVPDNNVGKIEPVIRDNRVKDELNRVKDELEPTTKNCRACGNFGSHHGICEICKDNKCWTEITKNDLGVDCISRQAVLDLINADWKYENLEIEINNLPSVTPIRPKGHWIEQIDYEENCRTLICSNCDRPALHDGDSIWKHKFCPHCGADMREVEE